MKLIDISRLAMRVLLPVLAFAVIGWLDCLTGREVALFPLYILPVVHLAWEFGWRGALIGVVTAVAVWIYASIQVNQVFSSEWLRYYNGGVRGVVFALAGIFILLFKRTLNAHRMRMEAMRALLNVCHGCGAVQGSDGQWVPVDELLLRPKPAQCECPRCAAVAAKPHGGQ